MSVSPDPVADLAANPIAVLDRLNEIDEIPGSPVGRIILTRTVQATLPALLALGVFRATLPPHKRRTLGWLTGMGGGAVTALLSAYFVATFNPRFTWGYGQMTHLPPNSNDVALTFDDGPDPRTTPHILATLAAYQARATFFLIGERVARYPELVRRIAQAGHTLGVHGWTHRTMVLQTAGEIRADVRRTQRVIEAATGQPMPTRYLRPPYGFKSHTTGRVAQAMGYTLVAWSLDPRDYDDIPAREIVARTHSGLTAGDIILLHERPQSAATLDALPQILALCHRRGLRCVGLDRCTENPSQN